VSATTRGPAPVRLEWRDSVAVITIDNPPVNASTAAVRAGLLSAVGEACAAEGVQALVLTGAGRHFVAGSDLREFDGPLPEPELPAVIDALEAAPVPVVAALHGCALGGGFELALACDARVAASDTLVGLPEITLGIIPGAGGTQRLPRLVGQAVAMELVCTGRRVDVSEALVLGIVDMPVESGDPEDLLAAAVACARHLEGRRRLSDWPVPRVSPERLEGARAAALRAGNDQPNVPVAVELVTAAGSEPFAEGLRRERAAFTALRTTDRATALRHAFLADRAAAGARRVRQDG
jgi:3-hydroxyacyl-CoA dehydrogenase